ncbi:uncharacterized protein LOC119493991 [Sebastes umbrosus]|uniref:uncharacterized protein LOC119493991 n=1 Tax=Sebastes umbrosus TaxID=72105 RepID=UPI00189EAE01|nr:uncharacterized protein LOC119493991 [Sebastes umbrosus]
MFLKVALKLDSIFNFLLPGVETYCDGRQRGAQCYGALGGTEVIQLMDSASEITAYYWLKEITTTPILYGTGNTIVTNLTGTRFSFTPSNGAFRINELSRTDGGEYTLEIYDSDGQRSKYRTLQLTIQVPVSSVLMVPECLSQGEMMVSCYTKGGDSLQYSWTLDGRTLTDAELLSGNPETNSVTLKQHVSGLLVCSVLNKVSSVSDGEKISTCGYIYINCTSPNGTHISQWVLADNNTLCIEPTTTLAPTSSAGVETYCDGRQDGAQCYGALGGTEVIQLMDSASEIPRYRWLKKNTAILDGRKNSILSNLTGTRFSFTPSDGTFRINKLNRTDGGEYKLETFDSEGRRSEYRTLQLTIQAPVSSVLLVTECLSQGEMKVSCYSKGGDSLQYSWTLDGRTLTDAELLSGNPETNSITLKQHVSGLLVCSVRNNVSRMSTCGYIYINCTSPNGTHISQWVMAANNTLCIEPTTTLAPTTNTEPSSAGKETGITESISPCTNITSSNQTVTPLPRDDPWYISVETYCDGRQRGAQCYGALGGTVVVQLMDSASEIPIYRWLKNITKILDGRKNTILTNLTGTRFSFTPSDGTFRINKLSRTDGGEYKLQTFDSAGRRLESRTLQLTIQAPVSSVLLVTECLSQGEMKVSCIAEGGDSLQYSWTLDGRTLTDAELLSGNPETNSVTLKQHVKGRLVCSVRNNVSSVSDGEKISTCGVETYCDGRQDGAQCYGALGGTVVVQLMDSASEIHRYQWLKKNTAILDGRKNLIVTNLIDIRSFFTPSNGTFRINKLSRTDGCEYKLQTFDSERRRSERTLQLTIQGVETYCDGRQDGAQCYGALGGTVVVQLMDSASEIHRYQWLKKNTAILDGRKNTIVTNLIDIRSFFTPSNGTFRINKLSRTDGCEYKLQTFDSERRRSERTLQLTIQARVSSVLLVPECLSQGEMKVSCSSEGGDSLQYSWTLDGRTLTDAELLSGNPETNSVTLKQHVSGLLVCSVRNNVSRMSTCGFTLMECTLSNKLHLSRWVLSGNNSLCESTASTPITEASTADHSLLICGVRAAVVTLALIGIAVYFAWKKKKDKKAVRRQMEQENSVVMVDMRSAAAR